MVSNFPAELVHSWIVYSRNLHLPLHFPLLLHSVQRVICAARRRARWQPGRHSTSAGRWFFVGDRPDGPDAPPGIDAVFVPGGRTLGVGAAFCLGTVQGRGTGAPFGGRGSGPVRRNWLTAGYDNR